MQLGYLGPEGTFTEMVALKFKDRYDLKSFQTIFDVTNNVSNGVVDYGVIPIENSTEGTVNSTLDSIIFDFDVFIHKKIILPVTHQFMVSKNFKGGDITHILSHPQSLAQCASFLRRHYHGVQTIETRSNSEAVKLVSETNLPYAAIGPLNCADIYDMIIIHQNIQDNFDNTTQFILISKERTQGIISGNTASIAFSTLNKPGELYKLLDIFSIWDINMTKILSRPMKKRSGEYVFFVDLEILNEKDFEDALKMIERKASFFKLLGCYETEWA